MLPPKLVLYCPLFLVVIVGYQRHASGSFGNDHTHTPVLALYQNQWKRDTGKFLKSLRGDSSNTLPIKYKYFTNKAI